MRQSQHFEHDRRIESVLLGESFQERDLFMSVAVQYNDYLSENKLARGLVLVGAVSSHERLQLLCH